MNTHKKNKKKNLKKKNKKNFDCIKEKNQLTEGLMNKLTLRIYVRKLYRKPLMNSYISLFN